MGIVFIILGIILFGVSLLFSHWKVNNWGFVSAISLLVTIVGIVTIVLEGGI